MNKLPTLRDVAKLAGVSHMTVSRVVRGESTVKEATVRRVRKAIKEINYRPQPHLSALAAIRARSSGRPRGSTLGFLDWDGMPYSLKVMEGARSESIAFGYSFEHIPLRGMTPEELRRLGRMLFHRGVEGLLFGPSDFPIELHGWNWEGFAAVSLGVLPHSPEIHAVAMDYFRALQMGLATLQAEGFRRIGLLLSHRLEARTSHQWLGSYLAIAGSDIPPFLFGEAIPEIDEIQCWVKAHRIEAVLTIHGDLEGSLQELELHTFYLNEHEAPPGSEFISLPPEIIGREGSRLLHHSLLRRELGLPEYPKTVLLRGRLISKKKGN